MVRSSSDLDTEVYYGYKIFNNILKHTISRGIHLFGATQERERSIPADSFIWFNKRRLSNTCIEQQYGNRTEIAEVLPDNTVGRVRAYFTGYRFTINKIIKYVTRNVC